MLTLSMPAAMTGIENSGISPNDMPDTIPLTIPLDSFFMNVECLLFLLI